MRIFSTLHRRSFVELFGNDSGFLTGFALHGGRLKWRLQAGYNKGVPANPGVTVISARESIASIPSFAPPPGRRAPAPHPATHSAARRSPRPCPPRSSRTRGRPPPPDRPGREHTRITQAGHAQSIRGAPDIPATRLPPYP